MKSATFNRGATWGLEQYLIERQGVRSFALPPIRGYLAGCVSGGDYLSGVLHGFALGAMFDVRCNTATLVGRA